VLRRPDTVAPTLALPLERPQISERPSQLSRSLLCCLAASRNLRGLHAPFLLRAQLFESLAVRAHMRDERS
jgi:hypothetical protein